ncbi:hypothetical protein DFA_06214 [Cavenderia fasciculata]|uniref:Ubiquitin-like domain-containing protein n=1 Tax=Cavenderia fasciculata TaxID=261658 RepID=F4PKF2_CACFS|nr:uncharacterized protein DFA_06214 [Cavenderia fasciculata]EGG24076.1 hypothetical protein DFA_06214 [Cavenderia fasciculata]|eukprot:XP_004361927.1 hypothetical protein DFA_06214 [Cavenderia fasciculata]
MKSTNIPPLFYYEEKKKYNSTTMVFGSKKKKEGEGGSSPNLAPVSSQAINPVARTGIKIGSVANSASAEQLDQIAANKQKIPSLFRLLAEQKLSEKEIWEGQPSLFAILYQFKEQLSKTESPPNIVTFHLPQLPEFGDVKKKSYKLNKKFTIAQTISLICKKQQIPDPKRFWVGSLQGFIMNDNEHLYTYGLGSLFESWELRLILKEDILSKSPLKYEPIESIGTEFIVVFELPPLEEFNGLKKHVVKVDANHTIKQGIQNIMKKYRVEGHDRFSVMTIDENPLVEFVLFSGACFKHYGLGYKFKKWDLKIVFTDLIAPYVHRHTVIPMHGWAQVSPGQLDPFTARAIINDLEEKCSEFQAQIRRLNKDVGEGNDLSQQQQAEIERLREEIRKLQRTLEEERENTQEQNTIYESKLLASNAEIETLNSQLRGIKARLDETTQQLQQARISNDDLSSTLHLCQAEKEDLHQQHSEALAEIATLQSKLLQLRQASESTEIQLSSMIATLEKEKVAIKDEARLMIERITTEKVSQEEVVTQLQASQALLVTQLQDDISSMNREREMMALSVQKATFEKQDAVAQAEKAVLKMEELQKSAKKVERQFGDLERERDVLRQQVQIKLDEIADLQKDLEWSRETMADMERRLVNATGEAKMYKDIKDKEAERFKKSTQEEKATKQDLDQEKQKSLASTARYQKQMSDTESQRKTAEAAYNNAVTQFKKREELLTTQLEDYKRQYEELRQQITSGHAPTSAPELTPYAGQKSGSFISARPRKPANAAAAEDIPNSPVSISSPDTNNNGSSGDSTTLESKPADTRDVTVVADGLYQSLQSRFRNMSRQEVEELEESDNDE